MGEREQRQKSRNREIEREMSLAIRKNGRLSAVIDAIASADEEALESAWRVVRPEEIAHLLAHRDFWATAGIGAAQAGDEQTLQRLAALGWKGEGSDGDGLSAGHYAARRGRPEALRMLLDLGWDLGSEGRSSGSSAGHQAARGWHWGSESGSSEGSEACLRLLIERGWSVNDRDNDGETAGHWAAAWGEEGSLRILAEAGWNPQSICYRGWTAGHSAASRGQEGAVRLLLEMGWDPTWRDKEGHLPSKIAKTWGHEDCADLLRGAERAWAEKRALREIEAGACKSGKPGRGM